MTIDNQIEIPPSFMAMYITPGRDRPNAPQEVVVARYELCEDMACMLTEQKILLQCHQGLLADPVALNAKESMWVIHRLAELLEWPPLMF